MRWFEARFQRRTRVIARIVLVLVLGPLLGLTGWDYATENFAVVEQGRVYRSGQMSASSLARTIRDQRIKTVLNLRGANPKAGWYRAERTATTSAGATQIDVSLSSCEWMSRAQIRTLLDVLDTAERPLLIHCQWGSERTGLVSAFSELLRPGATLDDARNQFSIRFLYVPAGDGKVMGEHLERYGQWLAEKRWAHTPERFRLWARQDYAPGTPSREAWPYDPYPLIVVTRPEPSASLAVGGGADGSRR
jgi:protein tyrosine phosphatase (PTP) superfamily phosphohydrolase (DUF442 family)